MTALAIAAFFGLAGVGYVFGHAKPTHVKILCPKDGPFAFGHDKKSRTTINGKVLPPGDTFRYNPPSCRFELDTPALHNGPLLFR